MFRQYQLNIISHKMYLAVDQLDEEAFLQVLNGRWAKLFLTPFRMNSSKIRFYSATRNEEEIRKLAEYILPLNIRVKEKTGLLSQLFSFYLEEENEQMAKRICDSLEECLKKQKNMEPYIEEMSLLMDIYIYGDGKREAELLKLIETVKGEQKAICEIRLGVLYTKMKRNEDAKRMFEQAKEHTAKPEEVERIRERFLGK